MNKMMITITTIFILLTIVGEGTNALVASEQYLIENLEGANQFLINEPGYSYRDIEKIVNNYTFPFKFRIPEYVTGELIVKFKEDISISIGQSSNGIVSTGIESIDTLNSRYNIISCEEISESDNSPELSNIFKFTLKEGGELFAIAEEYGNDSNVEFAHPNYIVDFYGVQGETAINKQTQMPTSIPNDPYFNQQWALDNTGQNGGTPDADIDAPEAWEITTGDNEVIISIIDTGVDYNHPDLVANIWSNKDEIAGNGVDDDNNGYIDDIRGWNFENNNNDPMDDYSHGTHCAGIIAATINNGLGIAGVAEHCKIMPIKIGTVEDASKAIKYAVDNGADIISMSFGISNWFETNETNIFDLYLSWADFKGVVLIAAAGNDGYYIEESPASHNKVLAVTATDNNDAKAEFSSYGLKSDVAAPGLDIYSTVWQNSPEFGFVSNLSVNQEYFESRAFAYTGIGNVSGELVYVELGRISDLEGIDLTDKIALIQRGEITFSEKVDNVYNKGAIGAIIFNYGPDNFEGSLEEIKQIPVVSISGYDGGIILQFLSQGTVQTSLSVLKNPYEWFSGTSMSCPIVAGVAALVLSQNPDLTPQEVKTILKSSVDSVNSNVFIGTGRINAYKAVNKAGHVVAEFDSSLDYKIIDGTFNIKGTAKGLDFNRYVVEYSNGTEAYPSENSWKVIGGSSNRKYNQNLVSWDTRNIPDGPYTLRLKVYSDNNEIYIDRTSVIVDNMAQTFYIDDDYNEGTPGWGYDHFNIIQDAVILSGNKDQIFVHSGAYTSELMIEYRKITIKGENIDNTVLELSGPNVYRGGLKISNLTLNKCGFGGYFSSDNAISNCKFIGTEEFFSSIVFLFSSRNTITNNLINNPPRKDRMAIFFLSSKNNIISNNVITSGGIRTCIGFNRNVVSKNQLGYILTDLGAKFNDISENIINIRDDKYGGYGICLRWARFNYIHDNQISHVHNYEYNTTGIILDSLGVKFGSILPYGDAAFNSIKNNTISDCDRGILITSWNLLGNISTTKYNTITENQILDCGIGIFIAGAANNTIKKNTIKNNDNGIKIIPNGDIQSNDNYIYSNDFIDNIEQAFDSCSNTWYLPILEEGNYWSDHPGGEIIHRWLRPDVWKTPYSITGGTNKDEFPLVDQYNSDNQQSNQQSNPSSQSQPGSQQISTTTQQSTTTSSTTTSSPASAQPSSSQSGSTSTTQSTASTTSSTSQSIQIIAKTTSR